MGLKTSAQSHASRRLILVAIYALIALAAPFAYRLTAVQRLPIDARTIRERAKDLDTTGCVVRVPARVSVGGVNNEDVQSHVVQLLDLASEARNVHGDQRSDEIANAWCVDWRFADSASQADFKYTLDASSLSIPLAAASVSDYSSYSLALSISRRIALDLQLPFRARLAVDSPLKSTTSVEGQDLHEPAPEPEVAQTDPDTDGSIPTSVAATTPNNAPPLPDLQLPDEDDVVSSLLSTTSTSLPASSDTSINLPSHLNLHLHILNEDFNTSSPKTLPPANAAFTRALRAEFASLQRQLAPVTQLGLTTAWGIGKRTQDVQWQQVDWTEERRWLEEADVMEMQDVPFVDDEDGESKTRREPVKVRRNLTHVDWEQRTVHYLPSDQLEIFVDESGWDVTDRGSASVSPTPRELEVFPHLAHNNNLPRASLNTSSASQLKSLHFIIYNPAPEHRPLVYLGDDIDVDTADRGEIITSRAKSTPANRHWGWAVPTWGGVVIYNHDSNSSSEDKSEPTVDATSTLPLIAEQLRSLVGLPDDGTRTLWHLYRQTIRQRTAESVQTLQATLNSIEKLGNLEIGPGVQANVQASLDALEQLTNPSNNNELNSSSTFALSLAASTHASQAFHHPRMVGMLYFPAEHVYAVYTPLFGPLAVPLILVGIKELKRILKERKKKQKEGRSSRQGGTTTGPGPHHRQKVD